MTTQEIINYYAGLLILQYRGSPNAYATIQTLVGPEIMDQLPTQVQDAFNLPTAVGKQLDILGKYIGISRNGFNFSGPVTLDDTDYLTVLQIKIVQNSFGSDLKTIQALLFQFFPGVLQVFDYQDMSLDYVFFGSSTLAEFFILSGLLPKPMGVGLRGTIVPPSSNKFFGFRTYQNGPYNVNPFNTYASYQTDWPWLSYANGIV